VSRCGRSSGRYLDFGSMGAVIEDLDQRGIRTNV
jgi:hypothetical protein